MDSNKNNHIDLFLSLNESDIIKLKALIAGDEDTISVNAESAGDQFLTHLFEQKNNLRKKGLTDTFLTVGLVGLKIQDELQWNHLLQVPILLQQTSTKANLWTIKREAPLTLNPKLPNLFEENEHIVQDLYKCISKEAPNELDFEALTKLLSNHLLSASAAPLPSNQSLEEINIATIIPSCLLNIEKERFVEPDQIKIITHLKEFAKKAKVLQQRNDLEICYPFLDSEQYALSKELETQPLALIQCHHYAEPNPFINQLIIKGLEKGERILVLSDRKARLSSLYNDLPIDQKCMLPKDWQTDPLVKRIVHTNIKKSTISEKPNGQSFLLQKQKANRFYTAFDQYAKAYNTPIFGHLNWIDLIGQFLTYQDIVDKKILAPLINSTKFEFSQEEFNQLNSFVEQAVKCFQAVNLDHSFFYSFQETWFTQSDLVNTKKFFNTAIEQIKSDTSDLLADIQSLIDTYAELYRDQLDELYLNLHRQTKKVIALTTDTQTALGQFNTNNKLKANYFINMFSKRSREQSQYIKAIEQGYELLQESLSAQDLIDARLPVFQSIPDLTLLLEKLESFEQELDQWRSNNFNQIQEEFKRFSKKHHWSNPKIDAWIQAIEDKINTYFGALKQLNLFKTPPVDHLLTYSKRLQQLQQILQEAKVFEQKMENFGARYEWTRVWLLAQPQEKELIQALIHTNSDQWLAALGSWYLNKVIEKNIHGDRTFKQEELKDFIGTVLDFYPKLLGQINNQWLQNLAKDFNGLSRKDKKQLIQGLEEQASTQPSDVFNTLTQTAIPLIYAQLDHYTNTSYESLQFDKIVLLEEAFIPANIVERICEQSKSILVFTQIPPNDPKSISFYLDQMPLVKNYQLNGKYYNTCLKLQAQAPFVQSKSFVRSINLHETNGVFDCKTQTNTVEADTVMHLLNNIKIDKQTRVYGKTGILCFTSAQRNLIWDYVRVIAKRTDEVGESIRQLERTGLQIGCLDDLLGMEFDRLIISSTFSYLPDSEVFVDPFDYCSPRALMLGIQWCTFSKAKYIDLVYAQAPNQITTLLEHNPGAAMVLNFQNKMNSLSESISQGGGYFFRNFEPNTAPVQKLAQKIQTTLRSSIPLNRVRLDFELYGIEFPLVILPDQLNTKPSLLIFDHLISNEKDTWYLWDYFYIKRLIEEDFNIIHFNSTDFWKRPQASINQLMEQIHAFDQIQLTDHTADDTNAPTQV